MFGFLQRAAKKAHAKLMYQNYSASNYIAAFDPELSEIARNQVQSIHAIWTPGQLLPDYLAKSLIDTNRALRERYDQTPGRHSKKFDEAFQPLLGWKAFFSELELS